MFAPNARSRRQRTRLWPRLDACLPRGAYAQTSTRLCSDGNVSLGTAGPLRAPVCLSEMHMTAYYAGASAPSFAVDSRLEAYAATTEFDRPTLVIIDASMLLDLDCRRR